MRARHLLPVIAALAALALPGISHAQESLLQAARLARLAREGGHCTTGLRMGSSARSLLGLEDVTAHGILGVPVRSLTTSSGLVIPDTRPTLRQYLADASKVDRELAPVFDALAIAGAQIAEDVRRAPLLNLVGTTGATNVQGETVTALDDHANAALNTALVTRNNIAMVVSEEMDHAIANNPGGRYIVLHDPLDGSGNVQPGLPTGTIFSILERKPGTAVDESEALQSGNRQVAAGYFLYGPNTSLVFAMPGRGVQVFTLDPKDGQFVLTAENVKMPVRGKNHSVHQEGKATWPGYADYLTQARAGDFAARDNGCFATDFHAILFQGGLYIYPPTASHENGKIRMLYEANPMALLAVEAGGAAIDGSQPLLDVDVTELHQRTPVILGSPENVAELSRFVRER